ncbi:hypothetical protein QLQ12_31785 [Actinoplanes sp. NEAU-A12]|uniref:Uncharacterized protein n=1 Tax=Actinoplanes sandaracinus TaxID=3045177 RepID=A0ABT6WU20_9ACTN|nr:hypothetical protein [Actinoplanes sandaracinus]MDI6103199.1 hypothetical protein [Actinoplanes sandaracinus]
MAESLSGFQRLPPPGRRPRPVAQGVAAMIAAVLILACGLLAGRWLLDGGPAPDPSPGPSRSAV